MSLSGTDFQEVISGQLPAFGIAIVLSTWRSVEKLRLKLCWAQVAQTRVFPNPVVPTLDPRKYRGPRERSITDHLVQIQLELQRRKEAFLDPTPAPS
jgi:hypothetical protein